MNDVYKKLEGPFNGVLIERAVERAFVKLLEYFQGTDEPLNGVSIYPGVRGIPILFDTYSSIADEDKATAFQIAESKANHIIIFCTGRQEDDATEQLSMKIVTCTSIHDGTPDEQIAKHEERCAAVRGILSPAVRDRMRTVMEKEVDDVLVHGWHLSDASADEFAAGKWLHTESFSVVATPIL